MLLRLFPSSRAVFDGAVKPGMRLSLQVSWKAKVGHEMRNVVVVTCKTFRLGDLSHYFDSFEPLMEHASFDHHPYFGIK